MSPSTPYAQQLEQAYQEGRSANIGEDNPYTGTGALARMWRRGYRANLVHMLQNSPTAQAYEAAQSTSDD